MKKPMVGAQLYSVRDHLKTLPDFEKSMKKVATIGYSCVQLSGLGPIDPKDVARVARENGLKIGSSHEDWKRFLRDIDGVIADHKLWDCKHLAIGGLGEEYRSAEGLDRFIKELKPVAARLAKEGMDFSYHNHNHEFAKFGKQTWLEMLYEKAGPDVVKAELDTYWVQAGGGDPVAWIRKCAGRIPLLHLKDMSIMPDRKVRMAEIGEGNLNWPDILKEAVKSGVEVMFVEQDDCYERDPFESLAISFSNLKKWGSC